MNALASTPYTPLPRTTSSITSLNANIDSGTTRRLPLNVIFVISQPSNAVAEISSVPLPRTTSVINVPVNALSPMLIMLSGKTMFSIEVPANALAPITCTFSPIVTFLRVVMPSNIEASISVTPAPNMIVSSAIPLNASASTSVTLSGI